MTAMISPPERRATEIIQDPRWARVCARDKTADGLFWYSVATTGVYCRPSCPARRANPKNVRFHPSVAAAAASGFRPCRRCNPNGLSTEAENAALIAKACRLIDAAETAPSLAALARSVELSDAYFHRLFKSVTGLTPKAYAAARRAARVREELGRAGTVTQALYQAGFNSNGRFYAVSGKLLGMTPSRYRSGGAREALRFAVGQCALGAILVACSARGVAAILLGDDPDAPDPRPAGPVPPRKPDRRRCGVRGAGGPGRGIRGGAADRPRPAARPARDGVPAAGVAGAARHPRGRHGQLRRHRRAHRRAPGGAGRGRRLRGQYPGGGDSLPPRHPPGRRAVGLPLGVARKRDLLAREART